MNFMKSNLQSLVAAVAFSLIFCPALFAQGSVADQVSPAAVKSLSHPEWQKMVDGVQAETKVLLEENEKLSAEYTGLQEKLSGTQAALNKLREEVARQEAENNRLSQKQQAQIQGASSSQENVRKLQKEIAEFEIQNAQLKKQLEALEEKNRIWETQNSNLQVQKREVLLDMKLQEFAQEDSGVQEDAELRALTKQLSDAQAKEKALNKTIQDLSAQSSGVPEEVEKLKAENKDLADQVLRLDAERQQKEKESKRLDQETRSLASLSQQVPPDLAKKKKMLTEQVVKLENQLESIRATVTQAKATLAKKHQLMDEIMRLDSENQDIRSRIDDLMKQIDQIKNQEASPEDIPAEL